MSGKRKNDKKLARLTQFIIWPLSAVLLAVPLVLCFYPIQADIDTYRLFGSDWNVDFFSQGKAIALYALCLFSTFFVIIGWRGISKALTDKKLRLYGVLCGIFILFTLLSSIFSKHPGVAFFGFYDRAEGFFTQLCYVYIMLFAAVAFSEQANTRFITVPLLAVLAVQLVLSVTQYIGRDLVLANWFQRLMGVPAEGQVESVFGAGIVYGTMYHYNHLGAFVAITVPLFAVLAVNGSEKPLWRVIYAVSAVLSLVLTLLSGARGSYIGIAFAAIFGVILGAKLIGGWIKRHKIVSIASLLVVVVAVGLVFGMMSDRNRERVGQMLGDIGGLFGSAEDTRGTWPATDAVNLDDGTVRIDCKNGSLTASITPEGVLTLRDDGGTSIPLTERTDGERVIYDVADERFAGVNFSVYDGLPAEYHFTADDWQEMLILCRDQAGATYMREYYLYEPMTIDHPSVAGYFTGREKMGSMRGYIWGRALGMLKNYLLLGSGPDTFVYEFPNRDLFAKQDAYNATNMVVDKAHNILLQIFIQNGGVAFLAYMALLIIYLIDCAKLYGLKRSYTSRDWFGLALCLAVVGYIGDGLFIDSAVSNAPIYWVLLGVGIAVNRANREPSAAIKPKTKTVKK